MTQATPDQKTCDECETPTACWAKKACHFGGSDEMARACVVCGWAPAPGSSDSAILIEAVGKCEDHMTAEDWERYNALVDAAPTGTEKAVCEDITRRQALGIEKYGQTVAENPLSLCEWLQHAYEETLDKAIYLKRAIEEMKANESSGSAERLEDGRPGLPTANEAIGG